MKKVAMIIASNNFRDEELLKPKEILESAGVEVKIISSSLDVSKGMFGAEARPDMLLQDVDASQFDALVFVGGTGASEYWENEKAHELAQIFARNLKPVGAICIAPVTLAKAGLLKGRRATVFPSEVAKIEAEGALYTGKRVEKDGNIITASGPEAAEEFGKTLLEAL